MTGRDPCVEAAQRALGVSTPLYPYPGSTDAVALTAAREMAKPIRERVEAWREALTDPHAIESVVALAVLDDLAPLIYPDDELKDNQ